MEIIGYLFGGYRYDVSFSNTIYKFNTESETISTLSTTLPESLQCMGVAQIGSNVYLFGGLETNISVLYNIYKFNVTF